MLEKTSTLKTFEAEAWPKLLMPCGWTFLTSNLDEFEIGTFPQCIIGFFICHFLRLNACPCGTMRSVEQVMRFMWMTCGFGESESWESLCRARHLGWSHFWSIWESWFEHCRNCPLWMMAELLDRLLPKQIASFGSFLIPHLTWYDRAHKVSAGRNPRC